MTNTIRNGKNGSNVNIKFFNKDVFFKTNFCSTHEIEYLGKIQDKNRWIEEHLTELSKKSYIDHLLIDWELYENGWYVPGNLNNELWNYKCEIGNCGRPETLKYLKLKIIVYDL